MPPREEALAATKELRPPPREERRGALDRLPVVFWIVVATLAAIAFVAWFLARG